MALFPYFKIQLVLHPAPSSLLTTQKITTISTLHHHSCGNFHPPHPQHSGLPVKTSTTLQLPEHQVKAFTPRQSPCHPVKSSTLPNFIKPPCESFHSSSANGHPVKTSIPYQLPGLPVKASTPPPQLLGHPMTAPLTNPSPSASWAFSESFCPSAVSWSSSEIPHPIPGNQVKGFL